VSTCLCGTGWPVMVRKARGDGEGERLASTGSASDDDDGEMRLGGHFNGLQWQWPRWQRTRKLMVDAAADDGQSSRDTRRPSTVDLEIIPVVYVSFRSPGSLLQLARRSQ
jgi:hypothetical protein